MHYISNPPNPWLNTNIEWIGEPPETSIEVFEETTTKSIITRNNSPDIPFEYSVNCYRGCTHACTYCFSRPKHEYLGFGAGTDFETKIVAKIHAADLLRQEFMARSWKGDKIIFSFTSDPYLPLEAEYRLTRKCLEVCLEFRNPVGIITKSALVRQDIDLIAALARETEISVALTIPFLDYDIARALEPFAPSTTARFKAMAELAAAGIEVGIGIAPVIPGLNNPDIPQLLERAKSAGASFAFINMLRLPGSVAPYFVQRLRERLPTKADRILNRIREARDGKLNNSEFGSRMRGKGEYWSMIEQLFRLHCKRLGLNKRRASHEMAKQNSFRRPSVPSLQLSLFE